MARTTGGGLHRGGDLVIRRNPVELHCIRHGLTHYNVQRRFNGWSDESITSEQARALSACSLAGSDFDAVYCSPLKRCMETAEALGVRDWIAEPRLKERNLGVFEGKTLEECRELYPADVERFLQFEATFAIPAGESREQNLDRVRTWLDEIVDHERVLAITHGGPIDLIYRIASGGPLHGGDTIFAGNNAHRSVFTYVDGEWSVLRFNEALV